MSLAIHDFLHFLPHHSVAGNPCKTRISCLFAIFEELQIANKKTGRRELGENSGELKNTGNTRRELERTRTIQLAVFANDNTIKLQEKKST